MATPTPTTSITPSTPSSPAIAGAKIVSKTILWSIAVLAIVIIVIVFVGKILIQWVLRGGANFVTKWRKGKTPVAAAK